MKKSITLRILLIGLLTANIVSCGKRGELLPPDGYQPPTEENQQ